MTLSFFMFFFNCLACIFCILYFVTFEKANMLFDCVLAHYDAPCVIIRGL